MKKLYPENSIVIVKESNVLQTQKKILTQQLKGIKVTTLNQYLQSLNPHLQVNWTLNYEILHNFKTCIDELHYFKGNALSIEFIQECRHFLDEMHRYDITIEDLPTQTKPQVELKLLLSTIQSLKTEASYQEELLSTLTNIQNVYIDIQHPTYQENNIIEKLYEKGAKKIEYPIHTPTYEWFTANNPRCEIEAIAQKIIKDKLDLNTTTLVYCDSSYDSFIASVFDRYQLPIHLSLKKASSFTYRCIALLEFAMSPTANNFLNCLTQGCFPSVEKIIEAQKIYPYNYDEKYPDIDHIQLKTEIFSSSEIKQLSTLLKEATKQKKEIFDQVYNLAHPTNYQELFLLIDSILRNTLHTKEDESILLKIQSLFLDAIDYLTTKEDLQLLIEEIKKIKISIHSNQLNALSVIPYSQINDLTETTFICGASQTTFDEFHSLNGIFDEDYVKLIPKYPSLMERYEYAHQTLIQKVQNGHHILFSYPQSDYLGKNYEASLDIENITHLQEAKPFEIIQSQDFIETIQPLSPQVASQLYTKNNVIKGSVSSLEKYVGCPYAYFLKYGCHIKEPIESGFNVQKIGTLNHSILEKLVNQYSKEYTNASLDEIKNIVDENINDMKQVFPHLQFDLIRNRLIESMKLNLFILNDMEKASFMTPTYSEHMWHKDIQVEDVTLSLIGFVDRIDTSPTAFRIIDYKSSSKKLEKEKVFSGQQLQLCTYLMQMNEELNLRPLGGFYYSFLNSRLELPYQKLSRKDKSIEEISNPLIEKEVIKKNRLQGWIFDDNVEIMDDTATHVLGVTNTKSKGISARNVYDLEEVSACIIEMMKQIVSSILSGKVNCEPNESACMFCKYSSICRFTGSFTEKKPLVELPPCMRKEKDDE